MKHYCGDGKEPGPGQISALRGKWESLSEFIKNIKQSFSRFYNRQHNRRGFFWGERFKSIVEIGEVDRFRYRTRYFTDSGIIGSKAFVSRLYTTFKGHFSSKHEKKPKRSVDSAGYTR